MSSFDPKELKILSDILALVLEEQSGQSASALEALKNRAQKDKITGGALKNLFQAIAVDPPKRTTRSSSRPSPTPDEYRTQLRQMAESIQRLDTDLRGARTQNDNLRTQLQRALQGQRDLTQQFSEELSQTRYPSLLMLMIAFGAGILSGIAGTELFHLFTHHVVHSAAENARYLY
ncbi:hypothetical protein [Acetobacter cibinongensis]|uniref:Uncharacterized protein n=1 Tax=Acetobacter cibinongensis TaxID=146475 RepID=A0A1Z5YXV9_9PROT|nr:hypothetical protein [Acetobacter cibinongensis]OUJ04151.1 hypothetical protein HK14_13720 [Acetobacter cibinongensis]GAN60518.1 hypothetical protein Abci_011_248 [Acetobacter cibinongensis]GBQ18302.1 hypothetical protein AA0482_2196 [Acetobacter cibinongensis NRIC 0482]GEL58222.1 hypothetical protein ACI01nite_08240 [Acetobacter cibinongensis]